jgi:hypothetical protein
VVVLYAYGMVGVLRCWDVVDGGGGLCGCAFVCCRRLTGWRLGGGWLVWWHGH